MKKINLRGLSEALSEKELKNVIGGSGDDCFAACHLKGTHIEENGELMYYNICMDATCTDIMNSIGSNWLCVDCICNY